MKYRLDQKDKDMFICLVLLNEIINNQAYPPVTLTDEDVYLDYHLLLLFSKGMLTTNDGAYVPTEIGRSELDKFYSKYYEYLKIFDIYCAVDLESGNFAFEEINNPSFDDDRWADFLSNERFSDVRVAVADFKGLNPIEIVFMSYLNEGAFEIGLERWQHNLTGDSIWNEIQDICNTAVSKEYLETDGVLENIVKLGSEIAIRLIKEADEAQDEDESFDEIIEETVIEEYVEIVEMPRYGYDYFDPYYDPYYISPIWIAPILLW
tara:strand:- start:6291 stop:7082 length:792 start_codon:yes stop_codon:yes gene_type:complete